MGLQAALERLDAIVQAVVPAVRPDLPFNVVDEARSEDGPAGVRGRTRTCSLVVNTPPVDDLQAGKAALRRRAELDLRIRYDAKQIGTRRELDLMVGRDVNDLIDAIAFTPADWLASSTGIDSVEIPGPPSTEDVNPDNRGRVAVVLTLPFTVLFHEGS